MANRKVVPILRLIARIWSLLSIGFVIREDI